MKFQAAFAYLKNGHRLTLPEWGGYWTWCDEANTIVMHTRDGSVVDIRDSENMDYTFSFVFRDDWELLAEDTVTEHDEAWQAEILELCDCAPDECEADEDADYEAFAAFLEAVFSEGTEEEEEECDCLSCAIEAAIEEELAGEEFDLGLERQPREILYILY